MSNETTPEVPPTPPHDPKTVDPCGSPNGYHETGCPVLAVDPATSKEPAR